MYNNLSNSGISGGDRYSDSEINAELHPKMIMSVGGVGPNQVGQQNPNQLFGQLNSANSSAVN